MVVTVCICRRCGKEHRKKGRARPDCFCRDCRVTASRDYSNGLGFAPREPLAKRRRAKRGPYRNTKRKKQEQGEGK